MLLSLLPLFLTAESRCTLIAEPPLNAVVVSHLPNTHAREDITNGCC